MPHDFNLYVESKTVELIETTEWLLKEEEREKQGGAGQTQTFSY